MVVYGTTANRSLITIVFWSLIVSIITAHGHPDADQTARNHLYGASHNSL